MLGGEVLGELPHRHVLEQQGLRQRADVLLQPADQAHGDQRVHPVSVERFGGHDLVLGQLQLLGEQPKNQRLSVLPGAVGRGHGRAAQVPVPRLVGQRGHDSIRVTRGEQDVGRSGGKSAVHGVHAGVGGYRAHAKHTLHVRLGSRVHPHPALGPHGPGRGQGTAGAFAPDAAGLALLREVAEIGVGERVVSLTDVAEDRGRRGEGDEVVQGLPAGGLVEQRGAVHLGREHCVRVRTFLPGEQAVSQNARSVHDAADRSVPAAGLGDQRRDIVGIGHVSPYHDGAQRGGAGAGGGVRLATLCQHDPAGRDPGRAPGGGDVRGDQQAECAGTASHQVRAGTAERRVTCPRQGKRLPGTAAAALGSTSHLTQETVLGSQLLQYGRPQGGASHGQHAAVEGGQLPPHRAEERPHRRVRRRGGGLGVYVEVTQRLSSRPAPLPEEGQGGVEPVLDRFPRPCAGTCQVHHVRRLPRRRERPLLRYRLGGVETVAQLDPSHPQPGRGELTCRPAVVPAAVQQQYGRRSSGAPVGGGRRGLPRRDQRPDFGLPRPGGPGCLSGAGCCQGGGRNRAEGEGVDRDGHFARRRQQRHVEAEYALGGRSRGRHGVRVHPLRQRRVQPYRSDRVRQIRCRVAVSAGRRGSEPAGRLQRGVQQRRVEYVAVRPRARLSRDTQCGQYLSGALGDLLQRPQGGAVAEAEPGEVGVAVGRLGGTRAAGADRGEVQRSGAAGKFAQHEGAVAVHQLGRVRPAHLEGGVRTVSGDTYPQLRAGGGVGESDGSRPHQAVDTADRDAAGGEFAGQPAHVKKGHARQHRYPVHDMVA